MAEVTALYDGRCQLCSGSVARVRRWDRAGRIEFVDLHDPSAAARFPQVERDEAMRWMQAVDAQGRIFSGADAWARIGMRLPGWKMVAWVLLVPGIRWAAGRTYKWVARNRYRWNKEACADGSCAIHSNGT